MDKSRAVDYRNAAALLKLASEPTRLQILLILADGEQNVGALGGMFGHPGRPTFSIHLTLLRHGGIIVQRRQGVRNFYALTDRGRRLVEVARALMD